ncbi:MAG: ketopantoate reductase family protein [Terriglobales bacterium]
MQVHRKRKHAAVEQAGISGAVRAGDHRRGRRDWHGPEYAQQKARLEACVREACAVANASGAVVNVDTLLAAISGMPAGMRSSMQKDAEAHRALELDAIAGPILRGAAQHGLPVPATREMVDAIRSKLNV